MTYNEMLGQICENTGLQKEEADRATRAFFQTLAQRLGNDEARELASQLPTDLQDTLAPTSPDVEKFSTEEFLSRVAETSGLERPRAEQAAHAVWRTVNDAVSSGEMGDVRSQLPTTFVKLFEASGAPGNA